MNIDEALRKTDDGVKEVSAGNKYNFKALRADRSMNVRLSTKKYRQNIGKKTTTKWWDGYEQGRRVTNINDFLNSGSGPPDTGYILTVPIL